MLPKTKAGMLRWRYGVAALAMLVPFGITAAPAGADVVSASGIPSAGALVNKADATVMKDGRTVFDLRFKYSDPVGPVIDAENYAVALADRCDSCDAVGIAVQVVFASQQDLVAIRARNTAEATDYECDSSCSALAEAYQIIIANDDSAPPDWEQTRGLITAARELAALKHSQLDNDQIKTQADGIVSQLMTALEDGPGSASPDAAPPVAPTIFSVPGFSAPPQSAQLTQSNRPIIDLYHDIKWDRP
jgi:hypothetical protein